MAALRCQHCDQPLTSAEIQDGWCGNCGKRVPSGSITSAAHGEPELALPRQTSPRLGPTASEVRPARSDRFLGWGTVRAGLAQVFVGVLVLALGLVVLLLITLNEKTGTRTRPGTGEQVFQFITVLLIGIGGILATAGMCMGCAAPGEPGPKGWAIGVAGCAALALLLITLQYGFEAENRRVTLENIDRQYRSFSFDARRTAPPERKELPYSEGTMKAVRYVLEGTGWLGGILFLVFLGGVATAFSNTTQATHALVYLAVSVVIGGFFVVFRITAANGSFSPASLEIIRWVVIGVFAVQTLWFLTVVGLVRGTVTRGLAR